MSLQCHLLQPWGQSGKAPGIGLRLGTWQPQSLMVSLAKVFHSDGYLEP